MEGFSNRFWDVPDILRLIDRTPKSEENIRIELKISPYDKRECYRLGQVLQQLVSEGTVYRNRDNQTFRSVIKPQG